MKRIKKTIINDIVIPIIITSAALCLGCLFFRPIIVNGNSMEKNYCDGDKVIAYTMADIDYGDVIVFYCEGLDCKLIKRVIAKEGDIVDIDFEAGTVSVNGIVLDESDYTNKPTTLDEEGQTYPLTVPKDCYFVLGDNRMHSVDSRSPEVGVVDQKSVIGKVICKIGK